MKKGWIAAILLMVVAGFVIWAGARFISRAAQWPTPGAAPAPAGEPADLARLRQVLLNNTLVVADLAAAPTAPTETLIRAVERGGDNLAGYSAWVLGLRAEPRAVDALIARMAPRDSMAGQWCPWALGRIGDARAVEPLIDALADITRAAAQARRARAALAKDANNNPAAVIAAAGGGAGLYEEAVVRALGMLGDPRATDVLIARLRAATHDSHYNVRSCCEDSLVQIGPPAVGALIEALPTCDRRTAQSIILVLGLIGDARGAGPIITCLSNPPRIVGRALLTQRFTSTGLISLAKIATPEAFAYLARCRVKPNDVGSPYYVNELLARSPRSAAALLQRVEVQGYVSDPRVGKELARLQPSRTIDVLIGTFDVYQGEAAVGPLAAIGEAAVDPLCNALTSGDRQAKFAIQSLAKIGDPRARPALWQYVRANRRGYGTGLALVALAKLDDPNVAAEARRWLADWPKNREGARYAIDALAEIGDKDASPAIAKLAQSPGPKIATMYETTNFTYVRTAAMNALVALDAPQTGEVALRVMSEPLGSAPNLQVAALRALVAIKHPQVPGILMRILANPAPAKGPQAAVHVAALDALKHLAPAGDANQARRDVAFRQLVDWSAQAPKSYGLRVVAAAAAELLRQSPGRDAQRLGALLDKWDERVKEDKKTSALLPESRYMEYPPVAESLCLAIAGTGDKRSFPCLRNALQARNQFVRDAAVLALGKLGDKRAVGPLLDCFERTGRRGESAFNRSRLINSLLTLDAEQSAGPLIAWLDRNARYWHKPADKWLVAELARRPRPEAAGALNKKIKYMLIRSNGSQERVMEFQYYEWETRRGPKGPTLYALLPLAFARCEAKRPATDLLAVVLRANCNWELREGSAAALGQIGDARAVRPLMAALHDRAWPVQRAAAEALGTIGDASAVAALQAETNHGDRRVRAAATLAIEKIKKAGATTQPAE